MPIQQAKSLPALYDDVKGYDLVLVPDAPLASALSRQLDRPHLGTFATTPRRLAAGRREQVEERTAFLELLHKTDLSWKQAAYLGEEIIHCWEYTAQPDGILEYDQFDNAAVEQAVEHVRHLDTTSRYLTDHEIDETTDLAVIGYPQLTELERSILPSDYDTVDRFTDGKFDQPPFSLFDTSADIINAILSTIDEQTADEVAIVLDAGSEFSPLIESALDAADIPFYGGPGFLDEPDHRAFLQLLRIAFRGNDVRVSDVQPVLQHVGREVDTDHEEKRLHRLDAPEGDWLIDWCNSVEAGDLTFETALEEYEALLDDTELRAFHEELETLGLASQTVTEARVDDLAFYLQSYEVPIDRENEGVLLADAKSATHVDRPLVFYIGLDDDWTRTPPRRPWVDRETEFDRHLRQFQLLLQNGASQYYLIRDTVGGSPVTPCLYFEELLEESYSRFADLSTERYITQESPSEKPFEAESRPVSATELTTISQSSLSTYVNSPRDYFFDRIVDSPDKDYFREGNLFHEFAEFYVHHPDAVSAEDIDDLAELMVAEMEPFVRDIDERVHRTRYRAGLQNIISFLDRHAPDSDQLAINSRRREENAFAEHFDRAVGADISEQWFDNEDLGAKGKIDLVASSHRLVDYKSGSKKSATQVVKNSSIDDISDTPNFQAILYLAHQRTKHPNEQLEFVFVHFLENLDDIVQGSANLDDTLTTVQYYPIPYVEYIASEETYEQLRDEGSNDCQKTLSKSSYEDYAAVFEDSDFPATRDRDELIESEFGRVFTSKMKDVVGDYKYVENGCKQAMRDLMRIRNRNYFEDELDAFEEFIRERLQELNARRAGEGRFPIADLVDEPNYRRVNHRDLLLEDGR
ncbi:PD-(D/E)XK nuclease family protein [Natronomonas gomsonensis]|uniref:PD-(D/E)XK nuclease family protein n=1 Tax=Natronomonas gomsonensis TaxID=1046043 RepID=UPI0020CA886F|nr:PD-(D/E)XK nuclease family protein [Natronomonas gomsonensis]MCY4731918.1 PD-(D/E)XK nuclease family protein [Natronomonas gomsonensis]